MNLKDRTNLLKDLCTRIPYGIKCQCLGRVGTVRSIDTFGNTEVEGFSGSIVIDISHVKPYLFPMSSMTEEQLLEIEILTNGVVGIDKHSLFDFNCNGEISLSITLDIIDWLDAHHFDYRGLIEKGLAINATGLNIY